MNPHEEAKRVTGAVARQISKYWKSIECLVSPLRKGTSETGMMDDLTAPPTLSLERKMTI